MEDTEQNKSEQATPFKLNRARQRGAVARGMDLGFLAALSGFIAWSLIVGANFQEQATLASRQALVAAPTVLPSANELLAVIGAVFSAVLRPLVILLATVFGAVLLMEMIQTGVVFSTQPLKPDFNRLNPAQNLKRLFSIRLLIETGKNVLKLAVYCGLGYFAIRDAQSSFATITDARSLAFALGDAGVRLLMYFAGAAALIALIDQLIVRRDFAKKMRMSRRELRRENRDREGEPRMKQRRKQLHGEFVKLSQSLRNIRGADVLVTNPTHYAVALRYDGRTMAAPRVVGQGVNQFAVRLRRLAFLYGVTIVENPPLARALHACPLNGEIPEALYQPVADIYTALRRQTANPVNAARA